MWLGLFLFAAVFVWIAFKVMVAVIRISFIGGSWPPRGSVTSRGRATRRARREAGGALVSSALGW